MYEHYQKLLDQKKLKNSDVARGAKVSNMTLSDWKHGESTPKTSTMKKIADFLGTSVDYLMTGKEPTDSKYTADTAHLVSQIRKDAELTEALKKYFSMSEEQKKHVIATINMISKE